MVGVPTTLRVSPAAATLTLVWSGLLPRVVASMLVLFGWFPAVAPAGTLSTTSNEQFPPAATLMPEAVSTLVPAIVEPVPQKFAAGSVVATSPVRAAPRSSVNDIPEASTGVALSMVKRSVTDPPGRVGSSMNSLLKVGVPVSVLVKVQTSFSPGSSVTVTPGETTVLPVSLVQTIICRLQPVGTVSATANMPGTRLLKVMKFVPPSSVRLNGLKSPVKANA